MWLRNDTGLLFVECPYGFKSQRKVADDCDWGSMVEYHSKGREV